MKKIIVVMMVVIMAVTGCSTSDLESYKEAIRQTSSYELGESDMRIDATLTFNEEGASFEEQRELSYFEHVQLHMTSKYDARDNRLKYIADTYYNFGGLGFDIIMYMNEDKTIVELPIIEKYLMVDTATLAETSQPSVEEEAVVKKIIEKWNEVLSEEDVLSGQKDYVMTDKGQIKTTTYTITINDAQFKLLKKALTEIMNEDGIVEELLEQSSGYDKELVTPEFIQETIEDFLEDVALVSFEGRAFVDFDGRLVRQTMSVDLINNNADKGEVETMHIEYETNYEHLGEEQVLDFPEIDPEDIIHTDNLDDLESYFPEGLF